MTLPTSWERIESLLDELIDLPEKALAERLVELGHKRPDDARAIRDALDLDTETPGIDHIGALLEAVGDERDRSAPAPSQPSTIGPWQLIELIASGGMGDVYRARRADGEFEATAALKRLRIHLTSPTAHDRFRQERQVLSDLHHPHIANLLDGGVDTQGVPYFVMEYVDGLPVTTYCDENALTIENRLKVFAQITGAVAAAHRQLVVHRDLKPPNILVAADGNTKLVDFGIAKLLDDSADVTITATHERMLTPRYAAPEQLLGGEITTATDVYGLGVVLFELLSGCRTLKDDELRRALLAGAEVPDPPRMSAAVALLDPTEATAVAGQRGTTVRGLIRELRGDLDGIVAKALRPDPTDRYPTMTTFAADLRRAMKSEPVEAHHGSWLYRMRKLWARHRISATALATVILSLTVGLWMALAQARAARTAQHQAAAINRFLTEELLGSADPRIARGRELTVREVVGRTSRNLGAAIGGEPEIEASIRRTLGEIWTRLGGYEEARTELNAARELVGEDPAATAQLSIAFAELLYAEGRFPEARTEAEAAVAKLSKTTGDHSLDTIEAMVLMGRIIDADGDPIKAESVLLEAVALLDGHHHDRGVVRAQARLELAAVLDNQGRRIEGLHNLRGALNLQLEALGEDHPDVSRTNEQMAEILSFLGWHEEAEENARRALEINHKVYGPLHWRTARDGYILAKVLIQSGRVEKASLVASSTLDSVLPEFGSEHQEVVLLRNLLAHISLRMGDPNQAAVRFRSALEGAERGLGAGHDTTMMIRRNFSDLLATQGGKEESLQLARVVRDFGLEVARNAHPDPMYLAKVSFFLSSAKLIAARDFDTALTLANRSVEASHGRWYYPWVALSEAHFRRDELDEAIAAEQRALSLPDGLHYAGEERYLVGLYTQNGDLEAAERFLHAHLRRREAVRAEDDPLLGHSRALLGRVLLAQGRVDDAERELGAALAQYDLRLEKDHEWRIPVLSDLGAVHTALGSLEKAEEVLLQALQMAANATGPQVPVERELIEERLTMIDRLDPMRLEGKGATAATPAP